MSCCGEMNLSNSIGLTNGSMNNCVDVELGSNFSASQIQVGYYHSCALSTGQQIRCWGKNDFGQLGVGNTEDIGDEPGEMGDNMTSVDLGDSFYPTYLSCGSSFCCALSIPPNTTIKCWGLYCLKIKQCNIAL